MAELSSVEEQAMDSDMDQSVAEAHAAPQKAPKARSRGEGKGKGGKAKAEAQEGASVTPIDKKRKKKTTDREVIDTAKELIVLETKLEDVSQELRDKRKNLRSQVNLAKADLKGAIRAEDDGTVEGARSKLDQIVVADQRLEELENLRDAELSEAIAHREELRKKLKETIQNVRQLSLF